MPKVYPDLVVAVALLVEGHGGVGVALPLPVDDVLVLVDPGVQGHCDPEEDLAVLPHLAGQVVVGLPLLPAALDGHILGRLLAQRFPHKAGLLGGTRAVVLAAALRTNLRHYRYFYNSPALLLNTIILTPLQTTHPLKKSEPASSFQSSSKLQK